MKTAALLQPLHLRWQALSVRERQLVSLMAAVLFLLLVWLVAVRPAWRTWRDVPAQAANLESQWLQMQRLAAEAGELKGQVPVPAAQAVQALNAATTRLGAKGSLAVMGDRATLTLTGASPEQLRNWLSEARQGARAKPVDLQLSRDDTGLSGKLVVSLPGAGA